jgi:hypothetical protein
LFLVKITESSLYRCAEILSRAIFITRPSMEEEGRERSDCERGPYHQTFGPVDGFGPALPGRAGPPLM